MSLSLEVYTATDYNCRSPSCVVVLPPPPTSLTSTLPSEYFLPPVIVWDPYTFTPPIPGYCNKIVKRKVWKLGQSQGLQPHLLHDVDCMIILISCQYVCPNNHTYPTTDPRVLELINCDDIPFVLLHKSGFLKSFVHRVFSEGMTIAAVERFIKEQCRLFIETMVSQI